MTHNAEGTDKWIILYQAVEVGYLSRHSKLPFPNVTVRPQAGSIVNAIGIMRPQFHQQTDLVRVPEWESCQTHGWFGGPHFRNPW